MTDHNCLSGRWPFKKTRSHTVADLAEIHGKYGIATGMVASLEAIFYRHPFEGDLDLSRELKGTPYMQVLCINPAEPFPRKDMQRARDNFPFHGIRVYPSLHGFPLDGTMFAEFMDLAGEYTGNLYISCRMNDVRLDHLVSQRVPGVEELGKMLGKGFGGNTYLLNLKLEEVLALKDWIMGNENVFFDICEIKQMISPMEKLYNEGVGERAVFGSFHPLNNFLCAYMNFKELSGCGTK
ncbi:MAG: hypothetical protein R6W96_03740 [Clostridia bacterium]